MTSKEFIISSLKALSDKINSINIRYAYDANSKFHIVEISPENIRRGDAEYMEWEGNVWDDFYKLYPNEDILISEPDETNDMSNVLFQTSSEQEIIRYGSNITFFNFSFHGGSNYNTCNKVNENLLIAA